jgi:L-fucose isomerase-like protein
MSLGIYYIKSPNKNNDPDFDDSALAFLKEISKSMGEDLFIADEQAFFIQHTHIFFVASGGSEQQFVKSFNMVDGPYYLLTRRTHNSLAAAMEILAFLQERGQKGEIIHGDADAIGRKLAQIVKINTVKERLKGYRLGSTGESSWLIASKADPVVLKAVSGMDMVHIPMEELLSEVAKDTYIDNRFTEEIKRQGYDSKQTERALGVYGAVRRIVDRYKLNGITIRCFDILQPACISGCLALAILNAEGIHAACEGDGRSLISMTVLSELSGQPVFMANPGRLFPEQQEVVFAHCVLPLNMPERYQLTTHFESGLGISIAAELPLDACTVFKCKENFKDYFAQNGQIIENLHDGCMCRTQIRIRLPEQISYFTTRPIANHHMICMGDHKALIDTFFASYE